MFAHIVVYGYPLVAIWIFRRNPGPAALIWTLMAAFLLLPGRVVLDLPTLPPINKNSVASVSAFLLCLGVLARQKVLERQGKAPQRGTKDKGSWWPKSRVLKALLLLFLTAPVLTVFSNPDGFVVGGRFVPGLRPYDALSAGLFGIMSLIPFLLARRFLSGTDSHVTFLKILCISMSAYAVLALVEVRLSPQLNSWIYGYFPHNFVQHIRGDGFRPLVFLSHGLVLGSLLSMALLSAAGLWRILKKQTPGYVLFAIPWLVVTLVLSKTLGALIIALLVIPIVLLLSVRMQLLATAALAFVVLLYPMLRGADIIPTQEILAKVESFNPVRAHSLNVRFGNEDALLARANERPILGWGGWGRNRIYDEWDGKDITITDGVWAITVGTGGWVGYIAQFGLLSLPLILLAWRGRTFGLTMGTSVLCLVHAANLIDLIPNSSLTPITWLIAGALWGRYELGREEFEAPIEKSDPLTSTSPYRRQFGPANPRPDKRPVPARRPAATRVPNGLVKRGEP